MHNNRLESDFPPQGLLCAFAPLIIAQSKPRYGKPLSLGVRTSKQKVPNRKDEVDSK